MAITRTIQAAGAVTNTGNVRTTYSVRLFGWVQGTNVDVEDVRSVALDPGEQSSQIALSAQIGGLQGGEQVRALVQLYATQPQEALLQETSVATHTVDVQIGGQLVGFGPTIARHLAPGR